MGRVKDVPDGFVVLRRLNNNGTFGFSLPAHLLPAVESLLGSPFVAELTAEGVLFRPVRLVPAQAEPLTPPWGA